MADITKKRTSTRSGGPDLPRMVKRARRNSYRVKRLSDHGTRHTGPVTISLVNPRQLTLAA